MTNSKDLTLSPHQPEEEEEGEQEPEEEDEEEEDEVGEEGENGENGENGGGQNPSQAQEWETMALAWVCAFPEAKAVTAAEVETWIDSNTGSLPADLQSMPRSDLVDRLLSIQDYLRPPAPPRPIELAGEAEMEAEEEGSQGAGELNHVRFQRSDRWLPVYSWLESLEGNEVVKSNDIADWLGENPEMGERLCSRHSKYHLFHYVKKCHMKILKRREKKKGPQRFDSPSPKKEKNVEAIDLPPFPGYSLRDIPKDSELYLAKRNEALQKYAILLALEKKLFPHFSKRPDFRN